jgi:4-alpha-glucanotransferase
LSSGPLSDRRQAGVCLHVSSLPGPGGIGDLGASARDFIDFMQDAGLSVWQFLPLGPTGWGNSPYQPLSSFAGNELFIALDDLAAMGLLSADELAVLSGLPVGRVDFGTLIPQKAKLLELAAGRFRARATSRLNQELDAFIAEHDAPWLGDYALFRILQREFQPRPWQEWPAALRLREPAALAAFVARHRCRLDGVRIAQFFFWRQWQALRRYASDAGVRLFGDLPIYIALDSADAWARPDLLCLDADGWPRVVAGVPPDYFSEDGQLWGNPLYEWERHASSGYAWWIERLRASLRLADFVRVDHFRGFEAYWTVPAAALTAREGHWEPGPGDALFGALREAFGGLPIVAENLGVITDEVEALRHRHGLPGMVVLQFAIEDPRFRFEAMAENEVCYTGTHDNDTTVGWFHGGAGDTRTPDQVRATQAAALRLTRGSGETIARDLVRTAFASNALLAIVPLQDLLELGPAARMNTPGKVGNNWVWRATAAQFTRELCDNVVHIVSTTAREVGNGRRDAG